MDVNNGFGSIFRQVFSGKRGNVVDAIFAVADAINNLAAAQQNARADGAGVCPNCKGEIVKINGLLFVVLSKSDTKGTLHLEIVKPKPSE